MLDSFCSHSANNGYVMHRPSQSTTINTEIDLAQTADIAHIINFKLY